MIGVPQFNGPELAEDRPQKLRGFRLYWRRLSSRICVSDRLKLPVISLEVDFRPWRIFRPLSGIGCDLHEQLN